MGFSIPLTRTLNNYILRNDLNWGISLTEVYKRYILLKEVHVRRGMAVKREDLSCLEKFDADSVLEVLRSRYANDEIYVSTDKKKSIPYF